MDTAQWKEAVVKPMEERLGTSSRCNTKGGLERKPRPEKEEALNCPRCNSTNTKFCYYNNYSLTQPRYFCKTCRRYWTEGGSLRNIPVGGGSRKNRRSSFSSSSSSPSPSISSQNLKLPQIPINIHDQARDFSLGFPATQDFRTLSQFLQAPNINNMESSKAHSFPSSAGNATITNAATSHQHLSALELLNGFTSRGLDAFTPMPQIPTDHAAVYSDGFPAQEFKPTLQFSLDGSAGNGYGSSLIQGDEDSGRRTSFPFEDLKQQASSAGGMEQGREPATAAPDSSGYWTGMIGGGSW